MLLNGERMASVSNDGLNIITAQIHGDVIGDEVSAMDVHGGLYGHDDEDKHLIWLSDHEISAGDEVEISFVENVTTSHAGKTIEELHPEPVEENSAGQSMDDLVEELSSRPKTRERFAFELTLPNGDVVQAKTAPEEFSYHLSVMWRWAKPENARVSLSSNSLEKIARREDGTRHATFELSLGQKIAFRVQAQ